MYEWFDRDRFSEEERNEQCQKRLDEGFYVMDNKLYTRGLYISPDRMTPLWDEGNTVLFTTGTILRLLGLVLLIRFRRLTAKSDPGPTDMNP